MTPAFSQSDRDAVHEFYAAQFPNQDPALLGPRAAAEDATIRESLRKLTGAVVAPAATHLVAWEDGVVVGALTSEMDLSAIAGLAAGQLKLPDADGVIKLLVRRSRILTRIAVAESHRRAGLGGRLVDQLEVIDEGNGVVRWCGVATSDAAIHLVKGQGYTVHSMKSAEGLPVRMPWIEFASPVENADGGSGFHKHVGPSAPGRLHPLTGRPV